MSNFFFIFYLSYGNTVFDFSLLNDNISLAATWLVLMNFVSDIKVMAT